MKLKLSPKYLVPTCLVASLAISMVSFASDPEPSSATSMAGHSAGAMELTMDKPMPMDHKKMPGAEFAKLDQNKDGSLSPAEFGKHHSM